MHVFSQASRCGMEEVRAMCTSPLSLQGVVWEGGGRGTGNAWDVIVSLSLQGVVRVGCGTYKDVLYLISGTGDSGYAVDIFVSS